MDHCRVFAEASEWGIVSIMFWERKINNKKNTHTTVHTVAAKNVETLQKGIQNAKVYFLPLAHLLKFNKATLYKATGP